MHVRKSGRRGVSYFQIARQVPAPPTSRNPWRRTREKTWSFGRLDTLLKDGSLVGLHRSLTKFLAKHGIHPAPEMGEGWYYDEGRQQAVTPDPIDSVIPMVKSKAHEAGWIQRQVDRVEEESKDWPEWKKRLWDGEGQREEWCECPLSASIRRTDSAIYCNDCGGKWYQRDQPQIAGKPTHCTCETPSYAADEEGRLWCRSCEMLVNRDDKAVMQIMRDVLGRSVTRLRQSEKRVRELESIRGDRYRLPKVKEGSTLVTGCSG